MLKLTNRFETLGLLRDKSPETAWTALRKTYNDTAYEMLGMRKSPKDEWISVESWDLIEKRADKKKSLLNTLPPDTRHSLELEFAMLDKAIKKSVRADKRRSLQRSDG